jgi:hypothetical protein
LLVPIAEATPVGHRGPPGKLDRGAGNVGGEIVDDSEDEGEYEGPSSSVGLSPEQVRDLAKKTLRKHKEIRDFVIAGDEVKVLVEAGPWTRQLGSADHPYKKAMRKLSVQLADDLAWAAWWQSTGYKSLWFHQGHFGSTRKPWVMQSIENGVLLVYAEVDLSLFDRTRKVDLPSTSEAEQVARTNLMLIMDRVAENVEIEHPPRWNAP